ncbi:hypothetical protein JFL43_01075 [Viridibacillus sp. YIM B01967]|uniref:Uncharacterized protein n=1 Tax=Viridibacillus soli TaxID=2798301 RepID=A0ABS1H2S9_9BACL|nr:hypothetical protein [Viridibacillus soli]MBK3493482.1 hypothetical protein [Viridibacillus soli]
MNAVFKNFLCHFVIFGAIGIVKTIRMSENTLAEIASSSSSVFFETWLEWSIVA